MEPDVPAHPYGVLKERLQDSDKQAAIDLYYELLSSGYSVGEILNAIGSLQRNSEHNSSAILQDSESTVHGAATDRASEIGRMGRATENANAQDTNGLSLLRDAEIHRPEKHQASEKQQTVGIRANHESGEDNPERCFPASLTGSAPDIVRLEGTHISTDREITMHC